MISRNSILVVLALAFVAPVAHADILYGVTGTYLQAYDSHGQLNQTFLPANHWFGLVVTDDTCTICTPGNGLLSLSLDFGSALIPYIDLSTAGLASFDSRRAYLVATGSFGQYIGIMQPQITGITDLRSFWIDGHGAGDLAGIYTVTPEPAAAALLLAALALVAAKLRRATAARR